MAVSFRGCLLYVYKLSTKAAKTVPEICINVVSNRIKQWLKKFSLRDFSLVYEAHSKKSQNILEANSNSKRLELAERFNISDKTIRLGLD